MQLRLLLTSLTLAAFVSIQAQNTSPYWSFAGNSNASASSKLGTTNGINLRLFTNNAERLTILSSNGYVGIGTTAPTSRFTVNAASSPLRVSINGSTKLYIGTTGGLSVGSGTSAPANGLYVVGNTGIGTATPTQKLHVVGTVYGISSSGNGVSGQSTAPAGNGVSGSGHVGVFATSSTAFGDGVRSYAYGSSAYGINASSSHSFGVYGVTGNSSSYAGYFSGNVYSTGSYQPSARKLKQNITELSSAMALVSKLQPKEYEYKQDGSFALMNLPKGKRYGLIAEDVEEVLPGLVKATTFEKRMTEGVDAAGNRQATATEDIEFKAVNYTELIPIMVKGMQELDEKTKEIEELKQKNEHLEEQMAELRKIVLELKNNRTGAITLTSAYLEQNTPNPTAGTTAIRFHVPETAGAARLTISNAKGQLIRTISISGKGPGQVNLSTQALASGTYNYTLYVDGRQADTKRLVINR